MIERFAVIDALVDPDGSARFADVDVANAISVNSDASRPWNGSTALSHCGKQLGDSRKLLARNGFRGRERVQPSVPNELNVVFWHLGLILKQHQLTKTFRCPV